MQEVARTGMLMAASQLGSVAEVAHEVLPELTRATHATLVFVYQAVSPEQVVTYAAAGTPDLVGEYFRNYVHDCPLHAIKERVDGAVIPTTRLAARTRFSRTSVYNDLFRPWGLDHHLVARLVPANAATGAGEIGMIINRDRRRGEYSDAEIRMVKALAPSLTSALRRAAELDGARVRMTALETLLLDSNDDRLKLVVDSEGRIVHVHAPNRGAPAAALTQTLGDAGHPVIAAARALSTGDVGAAFELCHRVVTASGEAYRAELSRTQAFLGGWPLVIVALEPAAPAVPAAWAGFRLTRAETAVLVELVSGRSNPEIGAALFISPETVRTHLTRIFKKLGVRSRLEAVVAATKR